MARVLRLGQLELASAGAAGGRLVDHAGGGRRRHGAPAAGADGHAAGPAPAAKVARETAILDRLSGGRLTLGVGLGSDRFGAEFSATGEQLDDRVRGQMLDEALQVLAAAWSGVPVHHRGQHYTVDGIQFLPRPVQQPGIPVWAAGFPGNVRPLRRAARYEGFFPVNLEHPDQVAGITATIAALREDAAARYDIAVALPPGADPAPYAEAGATWWLTEFEPQVSLDRVRGVLRDGPARS